MFFKFSSDKNIYYEEKGQGIPLIFVPGWATDHSIFKKQAEYFSKYYKVILFDPPGTGRSDRFRAYSFKFYEEVLAGLIAELKLEKPHLVGWSLGGEVVLSSTIAGRSLARTITLICSTPCFVNKADWSLGMTEAAARRFKKGLEKDPPSTFELFRKEALKGQADESNVKVLIAAGQKTDLLCAKNMFAELERIDLRKYLDKIDKPVYILSGADDVICPAQASEYLKNSIKSAEAVVLPTGHVPFLSKADDLNEKILGFLKKNDQ